MKVEKLFFVGFNIETPSYLLQFPPQITQPADFITSKLFSKNYVDFYHTRPKP